MFTKFELEVLETLWKEKRPLTKNEIEALTPEKSWKSSTLNYVLNNLLNKEAIDISGFQRTEAKHYARCYIPNVTQEEYLADQIHKAAPNVCFEDVVSALLSKKQVSKEVALSLSRMLQDYATASGAEE